MSRTARKKVQKKKAQPARKTARPAAKAARPARNRVITFRLSADEAGLIARAADRVPLARYSRDAVLARAKSDARK